MSKRDMIVEKAREWLGVKFRHQGRNRKGIDCVGLVLAINNEVNGEAREITGYERRPNQKKVHELMKANLVKIRPEEARPGDVVLMAYDMGATHLGILTESTIIHAFMQTRKVVEQPRESQHIVAYYRMPGVE